MTEGDFEVALERIDGLLQLDVFAGLAGLSLAAATFMLGTQARMKASRAEITHRVFVKNMAEDANANGDEGLTGELKLAGVDEVRMTEVKTGASNLVNAFYVFVAAIAMSALVDGVIPSQVSLPVDVGDVTLTGAPLAVGVGLLWRGARSLAAG